MAGMWGLCASDLLQVAHWNPRALAGMLGYTLLGAVGFNIARIASLVLDGRLPALETPSLLATMTFLTGPILTMALGIGFILLIAERLQEDLRRTATYDALTGVFSRRAFLTEAERAFANARRSRTPFSLLLLDLDHFKRINDTFGHQAGDEVLRAFAELAQRMLRQGDLFGRYGGEEFCALLPDTDRDGAWTVAERLRAHLSDLTVEHQGHRLAVTVSTGLAEGPVNANSLDAIIADADKALYCAKALGRNRVEIHRNVA